MEFLDFVAEVTVIVVFSIVLYSTGKPKKK
jgi:hypothetical protein